MVKVPIYSGSSFRPGLNLRVKTSDGIQGVRANPFLECQDNQRTRSCFFTDIRPLFLNRLSAKNIPNYASIAEL